jgi:hypothetical protein
MLKNVGAGAEYATCHVASGGWIDLLLLLLLPQTFHLPGAAICTVVSRG